MAVNRVAEQGFARAADAYVRGRPSYPPAAIEWLAGRCALGPGATVLDVGAGTGKLTELLLGRGATVIAVEPVPAMRAALAESLPGVRALAGTADALPLPDAGADTVTVGQAYHWFAGEPALAEFARVLGPDGRLALIWNARDQAQPLWREVTRIIEPLRGDTPQHGDGHWRDSLAATTHFGAPQEQRFPNQQVVGAQGLIDRVVSTSFIAALPEARRAAVAREVAGLVDDQTGPIALAYTTEIYVLAPTGR